MRRVDKVSVSVIDFAAAMLLVMVRIDAWVSERTLEVEGVDDVSVSVADSATGALDVVVVTDC